MLEPNQVDITAIFVVLVVLPVVLYILLGKWSEVSNRKQRKNILVEETAVKSFTSEAMAATNVIPPAPPTTVFWECARCRGPATTRCSRCKAVRYCSGRCQIIHWRQGHKERCLPPEDNHSFSKPDSIEDSAGGRDSCHNDACQQFNGCPTQLPGANSASVGCADKPVSVDSFQISKNERLDSEKRVSRKSSKKMENRNKAVSKSNDSRMKSITDFSKDACTRHKVRDRAPTNSNEGVSEFHVNGSVPCDKKIGLRGTVHQIAGLRRGINAKEVVSGYSLPSTEVTNCTEEVLKDTIVVDAERVNLSAAGKTVPRAAREHVHMENVRKELGYGESGLEEGNLTSAHETNGIKSVGLTKAVDLKKSSKLSTKATCDINVDDYKKLQVLFPFEEFIKFFQLQVFDLVPRGLLNIGNSCYANAVLQCLTCTKPLAVYLVTRTHSRTCCLKDWCLMCELEQHVHMLRDASGPLSPSRILSHIRSTNCQMGDGSQEDAHEFLRFLVASMQSISLMEAGGENQVHPILQETTFVQQTFGGRLRSKVVCLGCHHESERYENIMDLSLEIFGWVESLEDALTQFTTPEDLDGENMYRCGRCSSYVRARKQLSIDEAPNILTIVLKRFQEGNYGKINKCITFPEMLDMVPFMTGTNDSPPLYMLYGVVVHVDTLNASFSGHYVSYVKDLQGRWFRIDDTVVQPVHMSQVMSEGAYILFYMRSFPRPPRAYVKSARKQQFGKSLRSSMSKTHNSSKIGINIHRANTRINRTTETYMDPGFAKFSDATTSDGSLFTSSDDASFTSDSARDSFSTVDYSDNGNIDPFSSMFSSTHVHPSQRMISCRMFSGSKPVTRYVSEQRGYVFDSENAVYPIDSIQAGGYTGQVSVPLNEAFPSDSEYQNEYQNFVNYESTCDSFIQTFANVQL